MAVPCIFILNIGANMFDLRGGVDGRTGTAALRRVVRSKNPSRSRFMASSLLIQIIQIIIHIGSQTDQIVLLFGYFIDKFFYQL